MNYSPNINSVRYTQRILLTVKSSVLPNLGYSDVYSCPTTTCIGSGQRICHGTASALLSVQYVVINLSAYDSLVGLQRFISSLELATCVRDLGCLLVVGGCVGVCL